MNRDLPTSQERAKPKQRIGQLGDGAPIYTVAESPEGADVAKIGSTFRKGNAGFQSSAGR